MQIDELVCLVRRAQGGDPQAFDALVRGFQDRAVAYSRSLLPTDRAAAEDAAQEAFVQAWHALPTLAAPQAFPVWLRRIVFKYCDRVRRQDSPRFVSLDTAGAVAGGIEPFAALKANVENERLREAFDALPPREREAAFLYYWRDQDQAGIAQALNVPRTTIKNRLHAARQRLRKELWEMAEEILEREKPSRDTVFTEAVLTRVLTEFHQQMCADPHTADRRLLTEGRAALDAALAAPGPLDWQMARDGLSLLLKQDDRAAVGPLMLRYLAQPLDDSHRFWAYHHLGKELANAGNAAGAVLAHEALERLLPGMIVRIAHDWPYDPLPNSGDDSAGAAGEATLRLIALSGGEFADAWFAVYRGDEYLDKLDTALAAILPDDANRPARFFALRIAVSRCEKHRKFDQAQGYVARLYALADEPEDPADRANWRLRAIDHDLWVRRAAGDDAGAAEKSEEATALLAQFPDAPWSVGERHNHAHTLLAMGMAERALPLLEQNSAKGVHANAWGYFLHAVAVYRATNDRAQTLHLLRDAAVRDSRDLTPLFREQTEFADVRDDAEFLAAVKRPDA